MDPTASIKLQIPPSMRWDDQQLWEICINNRDLRIERNPDQTLSIMAPTGGETSRLNSDLVADLVIWNRNTRLGVVFDASGGFLLPNGSMRAPDAAWIKKSRWEALSMEERKKFPPLCPDFVVELRSASDSLIALNGKMMEWVENGCKLAWLIDPEARQTHIFQADGVQLVQAFDQKLSGEAVLPGFELDVSRW